ncbi:hypothetical protein PACILC2_07670 [Paenibacillus cisolokensis]|uniref:Uncharacterized protein n=1 Tax=Paenibacillus cisolokensis TaxID=1658519 RepID=A0ABQ4N206_9BACL|nr:hypothetical protein PACILC2_07670 [Paenibacillus cisolokensis]
MTVAIVRPENMIEMALARRFSGTRSAAMVEPIDMKTPCENAEMTRAASSTPMPVAEAAKAFPIINTIMIHKSSVFLATPEVRAVKTGAPNVTPKAYNVTVNPVVVTDIFKSSEISGSSPTLINSVAPMANALIASANSANALFL